MFAQKSSFSRHQKKCNIKQSIVNSPIPKVNVQNSKCPISKQSIIDFSESLPITDSVQGYKTNNKIMACNNVYDKICEICGGKFKSRQLFFQHKQSCSSSLHTVKPCIFPECKELFSYVGNLNEHLFEDQRLGRVLSFDSMSTFFTWLETESTSTYSSLRKLTGGKIRGSKTFHYYYCQFYVPLLCKKGIIR